MIIFNNVSLNSSGGSCAIQNISFRIYTGQFAVISNIGGSAPLAVFCLLMGQTPALEGDVIVFGSDVSSGLRGAKLDRYMQTVGVVFADATVAEDMTVGENVRLPFAIRDIPSKEAKKRCNEAMVLAGLLPKSRIAASALGRYDRLRLSICRASVCRPNVLLVQDAFEGLEKEELKGAVSYLQAINAQGISVVLFSNRLAVLGLLRNERLIVFDGESLRREPLAF
ncbi:MAG: ATP-binding cassette domain-containing protein [Eubacteriaceae bacterium]|nr:ATP-binding cassette domain-containing protein [Eubacteriaceae bacterium]